jgi:hypothetical protein
LLEDSTLKRPEGYYAQALPAEELSWQRMVEIEPRLRTVERYILATTRHRLKPFCANALWYGYGDPDFSFKERVNRYAGWGADAPELRSGAAYDIAYEYLYDLLPDCNHDGWCG